MRISDWSSDVCSSDLHRVDFRDTGPDDENLATMRWFLDKVPEKKPFFRWVNYSNPHRPFTAPDEFLPDPESLMLPPDVPDTENLRQDLAAYYAEIRKLDKRIGLILGELKTRGQMENTLIIFMDDNGAALLRGKGRSEAHTSELQLLMRISYTVSS